ncbi:MAG: LptA/OstA family protein [Elusimicrobiota bacterium]
MKNKKQKYDRNTIEIHRNSIVFQSISTVYLLLLITCLSAVEKPATITGNKMNILQKGDILEFIGNVKLVQQNLTIIADEMKSNEKTGMVLGNGNIMVHYSSGTENTLAWCDVAEYNKNSGAGIFNRNVKVKRDVVNLTCEKLEIFEFGNRFHAMSNVKITQPQMEATSNEASYDNKTKEILLIGGPPKIIKSEEKGFSEFSGDRIFLAVDKETVTILGNVRTKMVLK